MLASLIGCILTGLIYFALHLSGGSFPRPLSPEDEKKYIERLEKGDAEAKNILIEHNLRLVAHIIKKYYSTYGDQEDLISIGTIGLIKAISSYDSSKGARLGTYASTCIENEIKMHFRSIKKYQQDIYINDPIDFDSDGNPLTLLDILTSDDNIDELLEKKIKTESLKKFVALIPNEREQTIMRLRYGLGDTKPLTQREVAERLGISRSYVSRIEKKVMEKLRTELEPTVGDVN